MGFWDDLAKNAALWGVVQASKGANGKPDPYKAAGIAAGMGNFSLSDRARLGAMLGSQGAFDNDYSYMGSSDYDDYDDTDDSWELMCEDDLENGIDPDDYDTEEEYNEAISIPITVQVSIPKHDMPQESVSSYAAKREQYMWRKSYRRQNTYGLNINEYETEREFLQALAVAKEEFLEAARNDKTIYHYCGVLYEDSPYPYHYRTNDTTVTCSHHLNHRF